MANVVIYTAIFGGYDYLKPLPSMPGVKAVCFTDDPTLSAQGWEIVHWRFANQPSHPRMAAKWFRMYPNECLPDHRFTIWVDASLRITDPFFAGWMMKCLGNNDLALFSHPERKTLDAEVEASETMQKYDGHDMRAQVQHYRDLGYEDQSGLYAAGVLVRETTPRMIGLGNDWWVENGTWTYQDQLSLPFLLWQKGITPNVIPGNIFNNEWLFWEPHQSNL
jgi:hypothetical protein